MSRTEDGTISLAQRTTSRWVPALALPFCALAFAGIAVLVCPRPPRSAASVPSAAATTTAPAVRKPERRPRDYTALSARPRAAAAPGPAADAALDPEAMAIWEHTVEQDQQTLQPEDLEEPPPAPPIDYRAIPAYRELNVDENGNTN